MEYTFEYEHHQIVKDESGHTKIGYADGVRQYKAIIDGDKLTIERIWNDCGVHQTKTLNIIYASGWAYKIRKTHIASCWSGESFGRMNLVNWDLVQLVDKYFEHYGN